jgi:hypothetical protein
MLLGPEEMRLVLLDRIAELRPQLYVIGKELDVHVNIEMNLC